MGAWGVGGGRREATRYSFSVGTFWARRGAASAWRMARAHAMHGQVWPCRHRRQCPVCMELCVMLSSVKSS